MLARRKVKVVLLAAGKGERFSSKGYTTAKCNLPVKPPTALIPTGLADANLDYFCNIVDPSSIILIRSPEIVVSRRGQVEVIVTQTQQGAAASAYLASAHVSPDDAVLVMDTDNYLTDPADLSPLLQELSFVSVEDGYSSVYAGTLYTTVPLSDTDFWFQEDSPGKTVLNSYSYPLDKHNVFSEKGRLVGYGVNIGGYYFSSWRTFQHACRYRLQNYTGEATMAYTVDANGGKVLSYEVPYSNWKPCGTPLQYLRNKGW